MTVNLKLSYRVRYFYLFGEDGICKMPVFILDKHKNLVSQRYIKSLEDMSKWNSQQN